MEQLEELWQLVLSVWSTGFMGMNMGDLITALGIFLLFLVLRGLFSKIVIHYVVRLTSKTENMYDDMFADALEKPLRMVPVVMGFFFATNFIEMKGETALYTDNITRTLIAFIIFWTLYRLITPISHALESATQFFTEAMKDWFRKSLKAAVLALGGATILEMWGIEVLPLIAGLGLFGVAIALGAQDLFKNLIAGLFVIGERRFHKGDWVLVEGTVEGTVEDIGFRTTKIRRFDKAPVYIPNAVLSENAVTNFSEMTHRRIKWIIGVEYNTSHDQLRKIRDQIEDYITDNPDFAAASDVSTFVRIDSFNDGSIDILLYCFTNTTDWGEWLEVKETLALEIKKIVEGAGTGFAFPSRSLYLEKLPDAPEIFDPKSISAHNENSN